MIPRGVFNNGTVRVASLGDIFGNGIKSKSIWNAYIGCGKSPLPDGFVEPRGALSS
jgi:hypothetical protein